MIAFKAYLQQWRSYSRAFGANAQLKIWPFKYYFLEVFPIKLKKIEICQPIL